MAHILIATAQATVPSVRLNNGVDMPVVAFAANLWDAGTCKTVKKQSKTLTFFPRSHQAAGLCCSHRRSRSLAYEIYCEAQLRNI